ncbi:innexin inx1-like isoform X2 [Pectinophora gossypiella]|uniref:innexin inx1-like isoform X2 n=1 Tax=Pectinophora gossypiella TaxID=13191 RepID=UPI00214E4EA8|nr:innexin inx1-like isoform X2 [Pectinophora gossypiella]
MMFSALKPIKKRLCKYLKYQEIQTDNFLFRLHCVLTGVALVTASIILTSTQLVGSPIECLTSGREAWHNAINTYCWVKSTFLMPEGPARYMNQPKLKSGAVSHSVNTGLGFLLSTLTQEIQNEFGKKNKNGRALQVGERVAYPGVMNEFDATAGPPKHYTYYQWVCFVLFLQAILCYLPKVIWDMCEGGLVARLASGMHGLCGSEEREKKIDAIIGYFVRYRRKHKTYALIQWGCEALCLVNVLAQMWLMDIFLGGEFISFGSKIFEQTHQPQHERFDPLIYIFPRMTKCTFYYYGPSGTVANLDSLCVLPLNVINEKVCVGLWFWYIILGYLLGTLIIYRVTMAAFPAVRPRLLAAKSRTHLDNDAAVVISRLDFGDWWMFYVLAKNMSPIVFREFINEYSKRTLKQSLYPSEPQTKEPLQAEPLLNKIPL